MRIVAIDFETANYSPISICAAGLALFDDAELKESHHWLVCPPKGHGWFLDRFIEIHGIAHTDVYDAPSFADIAPAFLQKMLSADVVVAHNAGFDIRVMHATLKYYGVAIPPFRYECTLHLSRAAWPELPSHSLDAVAEHLGLTFKHHDAREDAIASGHIYFDIATDAAV